MTVYVNDTVRLATLPVCSSEDEAAIYAVWANEYLKATYIRVESKRYECVNNGDDLLNYFGFTIDSLVDSLFCLLPSRSRISSNISLIKRLLHDTATTKHQCCIMEDKRPSHYGRLSSNISLHSKMVSDLTGGRNPIKLLRAIRSDI